MFVSNPVKVVHDNYFTRKSAWQDIELFIPRGKTIWERFFDEQSNSASHLKDLGFEVIWKNQDFFQSNEGDIVISNCQYSLKKEVLTRLYELYKLLILLMPTTCLHTRYFLELFREERIQLIIPYKHRQFDKLGDDGKFVDRKDNGSFYTL